MDVLRRSVNKLNIFVYLEVILKGTRTMSRPCLVVNSMKEIPVFMPKGLFMGKSCSQLVVSNFTMFTNFIHFPADYN